MPLIFDLLLCLYHATKVFGLKLKKLYEANQFKMDMTITPVLYKIKV